jgi:hypothetical protein
VIQNSQYYSLLKNNEGKTFRPVFSDAEGAVVKVLHVDDEYEDFIFDLISSTLLREHYQDKERKSYVGKFNDLRSAELEE